MCVIFCFIESGRATESDWDSPAVFNRMPAVFNRIPAVFNRSHRSQMVYVKLLESAKGPN
jgi:hypothetical protein